MCGTHAQNVDMWSDITGAKLDGDSRVSVLISSHTQGMQLLYLWDASGLLLW
jgi:hypothetical protein